MKVVLPYPCGTLVRIIKLSASKNPITGSGSWDDWIPGSRDNIASLPVDYELHGVLMKEIRMGGCLDVYRIRRNGVFALGHFESTDIVRITEDSGVETFNSIYRVIPFTVPSKNGEEI